MKKIIPSFLVVFSLGIASAQQSPDANAMRFAKNITAEDAKKHLSVLASDEYEGRETGKEGQKKAAKYIAEDFKSIGLIPTKDNDYLQHFPLTLSTPQPATAEITA